MRTVCKPAEKGSQYWLQRFVNESPQMLNQPIGAVMGESDVEWLSPLASDGYAEYSDQAFLDRLGVKLTQVPLNMFWPRGGPRWDGLARTKQGQLILLEAKSHIPEMISTTAASPQSREQIERSLAAARHYYGVRAGVDWTLLYYQYANRLAHLYLLRSLNRLPTHLVFLYFVNDTAMKGPTSEAEWRTALRSAEKSLGFEQPFESRYVHDIFVDVHALTGN